MLSYNYQESLYKVMGKSFFGEVMFKVLRGKVELEKGIVSVKVSRGRVWQVKEKKEGRVRGVLWEEERGIR